MWKQQNNTRTDTNEEEIDAQTHVVAGKRVGRNINIQSRPILASDKKSAKTKTKTKRF